MFEITLLLVIPEGKLKNWPEHIPLTTLSEERLKDKIRMQKNRVDKLKLIKTKYTIKDELVQEMLSKCIQKGDHKGQRIWREDDLLTGKTIIRAEARLKEL